MANVEAWGLAAAADAESCEQAAIAYEDHQEVIAALAGLPRRRREAIVLRYWLDLPEREIAAAMGVSPGPAKRRRTSSTGGSGSGRESGGDTYRRSPPRTGRRPTG
jgi:DNA-directed RNA polymerase specialized sigma24 family protein